jgi:hypothetical protein
MSVRVIHGKPGSGKTCYCVSLLVKEFSDWISYEKRTGDIFPRNLYTNIPLNLAALNEYLSRHLLVKELDISPYIHFLDTDFFISPFPENEYFPDCKHGDKPFSELTEFERCFWWFRFPSKALIVIDEVHHYLPSGRVTGDDLRGQKEFMNYISTHRHREQDLILLTQHVANISYEIKKQIEVINEVVNIKNAKVGVFPFTIPMSDVDVVRQAWGVPQQLAHIKRGVCEASRVIYDKDPEIFVLTKELFNLYQSHTMSTEALDRPSLNLTRFGSLFWLFRRHVFRLGFWSCVSVALVWAFIGLFYNFPTILMKSLGGNQPVKTSGLPPTAGEMTFPVSANMIASGVQSYSSSQSGEVSLPSNSYKILGFFRSSVITDKGVLRVGDKFLLDGNEEVIQSINFRFKTIYFQSGKKSSL